MKPDLQGAIRNITAQLIEKYKPEKIVLFGSAARGDATPDSDVDLLIIKSDTPPYGADRIMEVSGLIERDIPIDFLVYRPEEFEKRLSMGDPFLELIVKEGKVLYG
jgi:predicted nucleotidyltransferase